MPILHKMRTRRFREMYMGRMITTASFVNYCDDKRSQVQASKWDQVTCRECLEIKRRNG